MNHEISKLQQQINSIRLLINVSELLSDVLNDILNSNSPAHSEGE